MGELMDAAAAVSEQIGIPREILSGLPVVEMTGDAAPMADYERKRAYTNMADEAFDEESLNDK